MTLPFPALKTPLQEHIPLLANELEKHGWSVRLFHYGRRKPHCTFAEQVSGLVLNLFKFIRLLGDNSIAIVQLNSAFDRPALIRDLPFALAARFSGKSLFIKFHGSADDLLDKLNFFWHTCASLLFRLVDKVGLLSKKEEEEMRSAFRNQQVRWVTVKNPVPADYLEKCAKLKAQPLAAAERLRNRQPACVQTAGPASVQNRTVYIMFASRLMRKKGLFDFIEAIPHVKDSVLPAETNVHFLIAGSGPDDEPAHLRVNELRLTERISWLGHLPPDKLQEVLAGTDIFVFPSHFSEGMPMALVHAMAAGNAIITTRVRFAQSYLDEPANCLFSEPGQPAELAAKLVYLIQHPEVRAGMRTNNQAFLTSYLAPAVGREYISIYEELLTRA